MICLFVSSFICRLVLFFLLPNGLQLHQIGHYKSGQPLNQTCVGNATFFNLLSVTPPPLGCATCRLVLHFVSIRDFSLKLRPCASISRQPASSCSRQSCLRVDSAPMRATQLGANQRLSLCSRSRCGGKVIRTH